MLWHQKLCASAGLTRCSEQRTGQLSSGQEDQVLAVRVLGAQAKQKRSGEPRSNHISSTSAIVNISWFRKAQIHSTLWTLPSMFSQCCMLIVLGTNQSDSLVPARGPEVSDVIKQNPAHFLWLCACHNILPKLQPTHQVTPA